jgi:hypothetical protein
MSRKVIISADRRKRSGNQSDMKLFLLTIIRDICGCCVINKSNDDDCNRKKKECRERLYNTIDVSTLLDQL